MPPSGPKISHNTRRRIVDKPRIAAHLIFGAREEPFLGALLASLEDVVDCLIVNDNSGDTPSANRASVEASAFARTGRLLLDEAPFVDFSNARNRLLALHAEHAAGEWIAFVDADEVHGATAATVAANLGRVPAHVDFVDGFTWHFFQSFDWYTTIERRMAFFRFSPDLRWEGLVHEKLVGARGGRLALPYVYAHYGHVLPVRRHAEKGRQYSSLGAPGDIVAPDELPEIDPVTYFASLWPLALRYHGEHTPFVRETEARMRADYRDTYALADATIPRFQPPRVKLANVIRKLNFEQRWRARLLDPSAQRLLRN